MLHIDRLLGPTSGAFVADHFILDLILGLRESAIGTKDELLDVTMHEILQDIIRMSSIDDGTVRL